LRINLVCIVKWLSAISMITITTCRTSISKTRSGRTAHSICYQGC